MVHVSFIAPFHKGTVHFFCRSTDTSKKTRLLETHIENPTVLSHRANPASLLRVPMQVAPRVTGVGWPCLMHLEMPQDHATKGKPGSLAIYGWSAFGAASQLGEGKILFDAFFTAAHWDCSRRGYGAAPCEHTYLELGANPVEKMGGRAEWRGWRAEWRWP